MDLCDRNYAFFHLPTLAVFENPYSPFPKVAEILRSDPTRILLLTRAELEATLSPEETLDFVQRLTSRFHEVKHYHDITLTRFGNSLFRKTLSYGVTAASLAALHEPDTSHPLPLLKEDVPGADWDRITRIKRECTSLMDSARLTLETSAVLFQRRMALGISEHLHDLLSRDFANQTMYGTFPSAFARVAALADDATPELGAAIHRLLIATLCISDPVDGADPPDTFLVRMLAALLESPRAGLQRRLIRALDAQWPRVEHSMDLADNDNAEAIEFLEVRVEAANEVWPRPLLEIALAAMRDFARVSASMRAAFRSNPSSFLDLEGYLGALDADDGAYGWPMMFRYTVDDLLSTTHPTPELAASDSLWEYRFFRYADGTELWSHRLQPQPEKATRLDRRVWDAVMKNISGPMALLEQVDWLHPLYGSWLRASGRERGVKYVRRVH